MSDAYYPSTVSFSVTGANEAEIHERIRETLEGYVGTSPALYEWITVEVLEGPQHATAMGEKSIRLWEAHVRVLLS